MPMLVCHRFLHFTSFAKHASGVIEDAKFKRREALADLAKAVSKK